jgi:nucleotide-binding universal stress UspA family protein
MNADGTAPIVVGMDGSQPSYAALDWGVAAARRRHLPVRIVHALEWAQPDKLSEAEAAPDSPAQMLARAEGYAVAAGPELDFVFEMVEGDASGVLVGESSRATIVVVGNRGLGGFESLLAGSVSVQTAAHAHCPVVVVRPRVEAPPGDDPTRHGVGRIVVGVDGSRLSEAATGFAFEEASLRGIGLTAVHSWRYPISPNPADLGSAVYDRTDLEDVETSVLARALAEHRQRHPDVPVHSVLVPGGPAAALIHESAGAELLVVGSRGHGGFVGLLLGSVSHAAVHHAGCPVAVIRQ